MTTYRAPLRDMRFVLHELPGYASLRGFLADRTDLSTDVADSILDGAAKLATEVLRPINRGGDEESCALGDGAVRTPRGFAEAFRTFADGGWAVVAAHPEFGGQHLPHTLRALVDEMICSANLAFASYTMLIPGAYTALHTFASPALKQRYLPKLVDGDWSATMCLTEAQSGSDLSLVRVSATPEWDGSYQITGTKIFVSAGEHDFTENIVHLVLARLPDAPPGTKGISLFVVPKFVPGEDGMPGAQPSDVRRSRAEDGPEGSGDLFDRLRRRDRLARREPHRGLRAMFAMMNAARLGAAMQGLGIAAAAYQDARHLRA